MHRHQPDRSANHGGLGASIARGFRPMECFAERNIDSVIPSAQRVSGSKSLRTLVVTACTLFHEILDHLPCPAARIPCPFARPGPGSLFRTCPDNSSPLAPPPGFRHAGPPRSPCSGKTLSLKREWLAADLPLSLIPQGFPLLGQYHHFDPAASNREALWNQAQHHLDYLPFPFQGLSTAELTLIVGFLVSVRVVFAALV